MEEVCGRQNESKETSDENAASNSEPKPAPNWEEAENALKILRRLAEFSPQATEAEFSTLNTLEIFAERTAKNVT